jgi:hypothetical protein
MAPKFDKDDTVYLTCSKTANGKPSMVKKVTIKSVTKHEKFTSGLHGSKQDPYYYRYTVTIYKDSVDKDAGGYPYYVGGVRLVYTDDSKPENESATILDLPEEYLRKTFPTK